MYACEEYLLHTCLISVQILDFWTCPTTEHQEYTGSPSYILFFAQPLMNTLQLRRSEIQDTIQKCSCLLGSLPSLLLHSHMQGVKEFFVIPPEEIFLSPVLVWWMKTAADFCLHLLPTMQTKTVAVLTEQMAGGRKFYSDER